MRTITINTTQNVRIEYELASLRDRFLAWLIDKIVMWFMVIAIAFTSSDFFQSETTLIVFGLAPIIIFYTILMEVLNHGQTLGKMALGIKVVRLNGQHPELLDFIIRWAFRMVDIWFTLGSLAAIYVNATPKAQRLGGIVSNTTVIRTRSRTGFKLQKLTNIDTLENHQLTYPKVISLFTEHDMIQIKKVLDRSKKYKNKAHQTALIETAESVKSILNIAPKETPTQFLRTVLIDYIILSR